MSNGASERATGHYGNGPTNGLGSTRLAPSNLPARHSRPDSDDKTFLRCRRMSRSVPLPVGPLCLSRLPRWHDSPVPSRTNNNGSLPDGAQLHRCSHRDMSENRQRLLHPFTHCHCRSVCLSVGTAERPPSPLARSDFFRGKSLTVSPSSFLPSSLLLLS